MRVVLAPAMLALMATRASAYSFPSCVDYNAAEDVCYGYIRNYATTLPLMGHSYNFQARAYNFTDASRAADNAASQAGLAVDPTIQNRTSAGTPLPNQQQVFQSYGVYNMLQAAPGQNITMTWPRTADPDGMPEDGSEFVEVYYWPNATINRGTNFSISTDPTLAELMEYPLATLQFYENGGACAVNDDKYNLAVHCSGTVTLPELEDGIYTFLWYWVINNTSPNPVGGSPLYLVYPFAFEVQMRSDMAYVGEQMLSAAPEAAPRLSAAG